MLGKYVQRRLFDVINKQSRFCLFGGVIFSFLFGFWVHGIFSDRLLMKRCLLGSYEHEYIGKRNNVDISKFMTFEPIDVVYTWVNGSDPEFLRELDNFLTLEKNIRNEVKNENEKLKMQCDLDNCITFAALALGRYYNNNLVECLKEKDNAVLVKDDEEEQTNLFLVFPKIVKGFDSLTEECAFQLDDSTLKHGCLTSSLSHPNSVAHPLAFYISPLNRLGNFKDSNSFRQQLPSSLSDHVTDLVLNFESDFALLIFDSEKNRDHAENALSTDFALRSNAPSVLAAFIVECSNFLLEDPIQLEARPKRFYDNEELRYSLRSLELYAPWVRHVYLLTNGQIPYWLNLENPHLTVVDHKDIFGDLASQVLPTFSSAAIETHLFNIPNLGERFIYFNDDFFLGKPIYPEDFITNSNGRLFYITYSLPNCAPGCPHTWIHDGYCDKTCDNVDCDFDGGDCIVNENVTTLPIPLHPVDIQTALERAYCSTGCSNAWVADGFCDSYCNVEACGFDAGDCGIQMLMSRSHAYSYFNAGNLSVIRITKGKYIAVGNLSVAIPVGTSLLLGTCYTDLDSKLRTSSFITSHSLVVILAYKNISDTEFTAHCELTFPGNVVLMFSVIFDTAPPPTTMEKTNIVKFKPVKLKNLKSFFDKYPPNRKHFTIKTCARLIPSIRNQFLRLTSGELTKLGFGVFLHVLLKQKISCPDEFRQILSLILPDDRLEISMLNTSDRRPPGLGKKLNLKPTMPSMILSHFTPKPTNPPTSHNNLPADAFSGALLHVNRIFNRDFGYAQRRVSAHAPLLMEKRIFSDLFDRYRDEWIDTAKRKFRSFDDMQIQFAYMYYVMSMKMSHAVDQDAMIKQLFDSEVDVDQSGTLSLSELRNLLIKVHGSSHSLLNWRVFATAMGKSGCFKSLNDFLSLFHHQDDVRSLTVNHAIKCFPLNELFNQLAASLPMYKSDMVMADDESAVFKMLESNPDLVESWLDGFRKKSPKFICLNDDMDRSLNTTPKIVNMVHDFLMEKFPKSSQFELPDNYRNRYNSIDDYRRYKNKIAYENSIRAILLVTIVVFMFIIFLSLRCRRFVREVWKLSIRSVSLRRC